MKRNKKHAFKLDVLLNSVDEGRTLSNRQKGETIFHQGDSANAVFYIKNGTCKVSMVSQQGKEAVIALLSKGDFIGEDCLTGQQTDRLVTVTAITQCELMRFDKTAMTCLLHEDPEFAGFFISYLLARNARIEADFVDQLFNSSEKRLARLLLLMANFGQERNAEPMARVSQATLAEMVGTTRSRVSYFLNKFRKLGLIECKPLRVHSSLFMFLHDDPATKGSRRSQQTNFFESASSAASEQWRSIRRSR